MASYQSLPLDELVQPISADFPAGVKLPPIEREKLDKLRKEHNPDDYAEDDPLRHEPRSTPNWAGIIDQTQKLLKTTSKDFNLVARLIEALTRQHGLPGLYDGLLLLHKLCDEAWERIHPSPELTDLEEAETRLRDLRWLEDPDSEMKGARFALTMRAIPLARHGGTVISVDTCRPAGNKPPTVNIDQLRSVTASLSQEECEAHVKIIRDCQNALQDVLRVASEKLQEDLKRLGLNEDQARNQVDEYVPSFSATRRILDDSLLIAEQMLNEKTGSSGDMVAGTAAGGTGTTPGAMVAMTPNAGINREQLYLQLQQLAEMLEKYEPHSPVPFLIKRAVELRSLNFPRLVEVLTRDARVLDFMKSEISEQSGEESSSY